MIRQPIARRSRSSSEKKKEKQHEEQEDIIPNYNSITTTSSNKDIDPLLLPGRNLSSSSLIRRHSNHKSPTQQQQRSPSSPIFISSPSFVGFNHNNNNTTSHTRSPSMMLHDRHDNNSNNDHHDCGVAAVAQGGDHDGYESIDDVSLPSQPLPPPPQPTSSASSSSSSTNPDDDEDDPYCTTNTTNESFITNKSSTTGAPRAALEGGPNNDNNAVARTTSNNDNRSNKTHHHKHKNHHHGSSVDYQHPTTSSYHHQHPDHGGTRIPQTDTRSVGSEQPPLLEIPEEVYAVRKAALQVLKPLNKTWVVISVGFALTVLFGMSKWSRLLPMLPYWFIVLPCWSSHVGLLWLHILSARALSAFIAEANDSRQRPDSRDHLNRTEYLPLLQRSLKFGIKTGLLSFCMFLFEILMYVRVARGTISLGIAFIPLWFLVIGGILDGLICKSQHILRVICWLLTFIAMILTVLKVDYGYYNIRWRLVVSPIITVLSISSASLIYIVYGHQIGYYRLTEAQLTAGNLYSLAALICIVLIIMIGEVIPLSRPVEIETRVFVVVLAPLVVCLVGMGAWVISRDEYGRLLLYGGQSAVHPMKLRWINRKGWISVQGRGVATIPMFGEVSFQPLEKGSHTLLATTTTSTTSSPSMEFISSCCSRWFGNCYPTEDVDDEEEKQHLTGNIG